MGINPAKVEACIERICDRGSLIVGETIRCLEEDRDITDLRALSDGERDRVLRELRALMAIFEASRAAERQQRQSP
jgi:hypothetical protein